MMTNIDVRTTNTSYTKNGTTNALWKIARAINYKDLVTSKVKPGDNFFSHFCHYPGLKTYLGYILKLAPGLTLVMRRVKDSQILR